jgi:hypothetical protein
MDKRVGEGVEHVLNFECGTLLGVLIRDEQLL